MAVNLLDVARSSQNDPLKAGVIAQVASSSALLEILPFENISGSAIEYTRENTLPSVGARSINEAYAEDAGEMEKKKVGLKIIGGDLDVDKAIIEMYGPEQRIIRVQQKIKALAGYANKLLIKGSELSNPEEFDGLQYLLGDTAGDQVISGGSTALSLAKLDEAIDATEGANAILMNPAMFRRLVTASRTPSVGGDIQFTLGSFGERVARYNGIRLIVIDKDNTETAILPFSEGGGAYTSIYVVNASSGYYTGLQNGGIQVRDLGEIDSAPVYRTRVEWYINQAVWHKKGATRLNLLTNAAVTA
jgi:hypothetical protein